MAEINSSIYQQQEIPDIMGSIQKGMTMRDMLDQRNKQKASDEVYKNSMVTRPDGTVGYDQAKTLSGLSQVGAKETMEAQKMFAEQSKAQREAAIQKLDVFGRVAGSVKDQASYDAAKKQLAGFGFDVSKEPEQYDPQYVQAHVAQAMTAKEQLDAQHKQAEFGLKQTENGIKHQEVGLKREELQANKEDKDAQALTHHLSQGWAGRSGQAGQVQGKILAAEAAEQLIDQGKGQKGGLDSRQLEELAQSTARLLGGNAAASARVEALVPHTWYGKSQSLKEYLSNSPQGQGQQDFVKRMAETVVREKELANKQMKQFQIEGLTGHQGLKKRNPELYGQILKSKGIDPSMIDENGRYKAPQSEATIQIRDPNGVIRAVKASQKGAAIAAGGSLVNSDDSQVAGQ